ncbi:branched-chain amino acid:cation transporter, LIVCS family [Flavobacteriaceae bacterium MAR_2010_188]|nr:branched-chain amino acid:cation transporter, LIVCS family [Flavobacteriaceae bacterium MAR_2010_188]
MSGTKKILVTSFALFSLFFGAGNLILPPFLGFATGNNWPLVVLGFAITAVLIPILGIIAHARVQGTMYDLGKKVSPIFSSIYCIIVYAISITIPSPRTASVTHEMAINPYFESSSLLTSSIYFALVLLFVMNRSKILDIIGKFLTPFIIIILSIIIVLGIVNASTLTIVDQSTSNLDVLTTGILEGYQTFDAIGAVVVGAVIVISINLKDSSSFENKRELITKAGIIAGLGLLIIYTGLIYCGATFGQNFSEEITRTEILTQISKNTLGAIGNSFLSVLVALACFTTAVGIVTGTSDYFRKLFDDSQLAYTITAICGCIIGVIIGSYNVEFIIDFALPALMFIYPITIVLIFLNVLPQKIGSPLLFKAVVLTTFLFSIPDFLKFVIPPENLTNVIEIIPLANYSLGWVLPAFTVFIAVLIIEKYRRPIGS